MTDYGHPCGKDQDCTLPNIHCAYPDCYKGKQDALIRERDALRALLREARTVVLPAWVGASPKPTHLAITPERQSLADRIDAALAGGKDEV